MQYCEDLGESDFDMDKEDDEISHFPKFFVSYMKETIII